MTDAKPTVALVMIDLDRAELRTVAHCIADGLMADLRSGKIKVIGGETVEAACDATGTFGELREVVIMAVIRRVVESAIYARPEGT